MILLNTLRNYIIGGVLAAGVLTGGYFAHKSFLEEARKQGFKEGQQSMILYARKNLEAVLHIDCQTRANELYNLPRFEGYYADPKTRQNLAGLEISMYCDGPDIPMYPQIPSGYAPKTVQVRIPEGAFEIRWEEQQFHTTWSHTQGLQAQRNKHKGTVTQ